jgi:hypothetical protein
MVFKVVSKKSSRVRELFYVCAPKGVHTLWSENFYARRSAEANILEKKCLPNSKRCISEAQALVYHSIPSWALVPLE